MRITASPAAIISAKISNQSNVPLKISDFCSSSKPVPSTDAPTNADTAVYRFFGKIQYKAPLSAYAQRKSPI